MRRGAIDLEEVLARGGVDAQEVGRGVGVRAMKDGHVQDAVEEERRAAIAPLEPEGSVFLLKITAPRLLAVQREALEHTGARQDERMGAVAHRRGGGHVVLAMSMAGGRSERPLPSWTARAAVHAPEIQRLPSATFRNTRSPTTIGVEPLHWASRASRPRCPGRSTQGSFVPGFRPEAAARATGASRRRSGRGRTG